MTKLEHLETEELFCFKKIQDENTEQIDKDYYAGELEAIKEKKKAVIENPTEEDKRDVMIQDASFYKDEEEKDRYKGALKIKKTAEKASIIGDTIGDPMKDTSGPSLNILIKLSSIISVIFGTLFVKTSFLIQ